MLRAIVHRLLAGTAEDAGAVLVIFAVLATVAIGFTAFVVDVGNWFEHKRHLQLQADAGAFAGAQSLADLIDRGETCTATTKAGIYEDTGRYAGVNSVETPEGKTKLEVKPAELYNEQVSQTPQSSLHARVNRKTYFESSGGPEQKAPEDKTVVEKAPCDEAGMIDIKLTETNVPWFFKVVGSAFNVVPYVNAHARVTLAQESGSSGLEPLAVAEPAPTAAKAYFVNEDESNKVLAESKLEGTGQEWTSNKAVPVEIKKTQGSVAHIGVVIALSGQVSTPKAGGTLGEKCKELYVRCFDQTTTGPLLHIAGYSLEGTGSVTAPLAREVTLSKASTEGCTDGYFSTSKSSCKLEIAAKIDYGAQSSKETGVTVTARVEHPDSKGKMMVFSTGALKLEGGVWKGTAPVEPGTGMNQISLLFKCAKGTGSPCTADTETLLTNVQKVYASSTEHSGPVTAASIAEKAPQKLAEDADSFEVCEGSASCTPELEVKIRTEPNLADAARCSSEAECKAKNAGFFDALRALKFEGNGGQIDECKPGESSGAEPYRSYLREGCPFKYKINDFTSMGTFSDPECTAANPYDCITIGISGNKEGARSGLAERFEHPYPAGTKWECHNRWQNTNEGRLPIIPPNDSRLVQVFIIPFGSVNEKGEPPAGREGAPILSLATFYVTGFYGDKCQLTTKEKEEKFVADDPVAKEGNGNSEKEVFEVVGHFIKYVSILGESNGSRCKTEATAIETCVVTLTE
jgi:Flp pilus assembly protein TadG